MQEHPRLDSEPPRSRLPLILGAVVAAIALVAATVVATDRMRDDEAAAPASSSTTSEASSPTSEPSASDDDSASADGCLGGVNPTKAITAAQKAAKLDRKGAAAFAATVVRWRSQFPADPDYAAKAKRVMSPDAGSDLLTVEDGGGGPQDSGWASTDGARYRVLDATAKDATVEISMPFHVTSAENPEGEEVSTAARVRLKAMKGQWRVIDMDPIERESARSSLESDGHVYAGVC